MKTLITIGLATLVAVGIASSGSGYELSPAQTKFTLSGQADILIDHQLQFCNVIMTGKIYKKPNNSLIETFSAGNCGVVPTNLPWALRAHSATAALIESFSYTLPHNVCEPKNIHPTVDSNGVWSIGEKQPGSNGTCEFLGTLSSRPPITIVP